MDNEKKQRPPTSDARYYGFAMRIVADFGVTIAAPAVVAAFLGVWLDRRFGTMPWLLLVCLGISFCLTGIMIARKANAYAKQFDALNKNERV